jgi:hypothetical protein
MIEIIKLTTGEELIADVDHSNGEITLNKPCQLQMVPSKSDPSQPMMGMFPYAPYTEHHVIEVNIEHVVWTASPVKELYNQYNSAFGSGIQLAGI